jgi:threonine dehydratase
LSGVTAIQPTTLISCSRLAEALGVNVILASETFQRTGSFKFRAALHLAASVPNDLIIAASSGNFGQALACACALTGKRAIIVMPATSARVKVEAVRRYGARVESVDTQLQGRAQRLGELAIQHPDAYIASAYDDPLVIAGNSSLGRELAERLPPDVDTVVVPIGGGGLAAGIIVGLEQRERMARVVGAEPLLANDASRSLRAGEIVRNDSEPPTIADGARVVSVGEHNFPILRRGLSDIVEVSEDQIAEAVRLLFVAANLKAEPTGALSLAALLTRPDVFAGKNVCCVISGGNVDPAVYVRLLEPPGSP